LAASVAGGALSPANGLDALAMIVFRGGKTIPGGATGLEKED